MYKYFTWKSGKYFKGQELLHTQQINSLLNGVVDLKKQEVFSTIQDYNSEGDILRCPLYFDIDDTDLLGAYETMTDLVRDIDCEYSISPYVWFSGSKGFHVVLPFYINHDRCHEIAKVLASSFCSKIDPAVYRTRSMWRLHGSINPKSGMYKVPVIPGQSLDEILKNSKERFIERVDYKSFNNNEFKVKCNEIADTLPEINYMSTVNTNMDFIKDITPCLKKIWNMEIPPESSRHQVCHLMARFCFSCGMTTKEASSIFKAHPFWKTISNRDYEKVIASVYKTGKAHIGCKFGNDSELLQKHCNGLCVFQDDILNKIWPKE